MFHTSARHMLAASGLALSLALPATAQQTLSAEEEAIKQAVEADFDAQLVFLEKIVNINSDTRNPEGVREVGKVFDTEFKDLGFTTSWIDMPAEMERGGHFVATHEGTPGKKALLIGHIDTVFPTTSPFQKFEREGGRATGPGIVDMKAGDAIILYALKALKATGNLEQGSYKVFFTGDEESTGKPLDVSRHDLIEAGKWSDFALNFEGSGDGTAVIGRRGASGWSLTTSGTRAHSSAIFSDSVGAGAIFEASRILHRFYNEVRGPFGLTFNPGVIGGGTFVDQGANPAAQNAYGKDNVVAQKTVVHGGLRFMSEADKEAARAKMREIVADHLPGTSAEITFEDSYPAMTENDASRRMLGVFSDVNVALGHGPLTAYPPEKRGAADSSFVAPHTPTMDGLGGFGGNGHTPEEWLDLEKQKFATVRAAILLYRLMREE
ncbi:M20/M25/M40 family metallo-hydrolase [Kordiimonas gwangyangensis]|uniref:M20/M25/M40 family metallo-hydrolase n=1 Tax=Kordiimonas gwangyangensis TaxID=288022 RepID=UPI00036ACBFF|nr:M20/M25/M40 family metallo-hydrolase [Kordiimonas gwangyangensis]